MRLNWQQNWFNLTLSHTPFGAIGNGSSFLFLKSIKMLSRRRKNWYRCCWQKIRRIFMFGITEIGLIQSNLSLTKKLILLLRRSSPILSIFHPTTSELSLFIKNIQNFLRQKSVRMKENKLWPLGCLKIYLWLRLRLLRKLSLWTPMKKLLGRTIIGY